MSTARLAASRATCVGDKQCVRGPQETAVHMADECASSQCLVVYTPPKRSQRQDEDYRRFDEVWFHWHSTSNTGCLYCTLTPADGDSSLPFSFILWFAPDACSAVLVLVAVAAALSMDANGGTT